MQNGVSTFSGSAGGIKCPSKENTNFQHSLTLLLILIVLSGSINHFPIDTFYWIEADTSAISGAPDVSRWTFWGLASKIDDRNHLESSEPAYPFSPVDNFDTDKNIPQDFISNRDTYYYLTRFSFAFFWIALAFVGVSLILSIFAVFSYSVIRINSWLLTLALLFDAGAVSFETAASVLGKNAFSSDGTYAHLGVSLFGIAWASVAVLIILFFFAWGELISASYKKHQANMRREQELEDTRLPPVPAQQPAQPPINYNNNEPVVPADDQYKSHQSGIKFFKIRRHHEEDTESL